MPQPEAGPDMAASDTAFVRTYISPGHPAFTSVNTDRTYARTFLAVSHPAFPPLNTDRAYVRTYVAPGALIPPMVGALPIHRV